ncbi:Uncharacterised protein [Cytobacillus firmus]|nr:Uncharacterised protein [Cytobacillus firmus]
MVFLSWIFQILIIFVIIIIEHIEKVQLKKVLPLIAIVFAAVILLVMIK